VRILKSIDVRKSLIFMMIILLLFAGVLFLFLNHFIEIMNNAQIKQNISLAGSIVKKYPESEEDVARIIISDDNKDYDYGKEILDKYSYNESLATYKNTLMNKSYYKLLYGFILIIILLLISVIAVMMYSYNKI